MHSLLRAKSDELNEPAVKGIPPWARRIHRPFTGTVRIYLSQALRAVQTAIEDGGEE